MWWVYTSPKQPSRHFVLVGRSKLWNAIILHVAEATFSSLRARRTLSNLWWNAASPKQPSRTFGEMQILHAPKQPSRDFVLDGTFKTVVTCKFVCVTTKPFRHFVVTSDVQNCGKTMIFVCRELPQMSLTCFAHFCASRCSETYISKYLIARRCIQGRRAFWFCWMNPLAGFGVSIARNCSETQILSSRNCSAHCTGP